jgi:hypothetical protein
LRIGEGFALPFVFLGIAYVLGIYSAEFARIRDHLLKENSAVNPDESGL